MRFVSRQDWGARAPRNRSSISRVYGVSIHWHGPGLGDYSHGRCDNLVRSMQAYHMDNNGWADIGYNALVCRHGYVFEGRGLGIRGAHAGASNIGGNSHWYGLQAMVGVGDDVTSELMDGLRDGIAWFRDHGAGNRVNGHRDHHATECPGDVLYRWAHGGEVGGGSSAGPGRLLQRGDAGPAVKQWQDDLLEWNPDALPRWGADGSFGGETETWTRRFQESAGIAVDGIVGPETRQAMEEELVALSDDDIERIADALNNRHDRDPFGVVATYAGERKRVSVNSIRQNNETGIDDTNRRVGQILAKLEAQNAVIDKLAEAVQAGPGQDVEALKREIREAIESVTVRLDVEDESG